MKIEIAENPSPETFRLILDGVRSFNRDRTGNEAPRQVACLLRNELGEVAGGVQGSLWGRSMHIDALWIDENHRGRGHGSELMKVIEDYALSHQHPLIYLETTSFQALPFYEGLGYRVFGQLPDITEGHTLFFLCKELST